MVEVPAKPNLPTGVMTVDSYFEGPTIYFITTGSEEIKIGWTTNLNTRLRALRTASPNRVQVHLAIAGTRAEEGRIRQRFAEDHIHGEWFRFSDAIRAFIDEKNRVIGFDWRKDEFSPSDKP